MARKIPAEKGASDDTQTLFRRKARIPRGASRFTSGRVNRSARAPTFFQLNAMPL
jgi:hypothetical protein